MLRDCLTILKKWKIDLRRKLLVIRGARQVGKSWLVESFAKEFDNFIEINFEKEKTARRIFAEDLNLPTIITEIELIKKTKIIPGKTLLFLDEIQECERAILALRYFKEELPELHVIAAGSLLDFTLEKIGMPVGRVEFIYLHPLSYGEFLTASGHNDLREYLYTKKPTKNIHDKLLELLKTYLWLGGMPAVVQTWLDTKDILACQKIQDMILLTYQQDFHKYAKQVLIEKIDIIFHSIPKLLGKKFVYSNVDSAVRAHVLKEALLCLHKAGIAHICYHSDAQGIPLAAEVNQKKFKVFFFDVGLAQRLLGLDVSQELFTPISVTHMGGITEQLVAQEYIAYTSIIQPPTIYYWHRETKSSNAEVDFVFLKKNTIIPVEVKAGATGSLKSIHSFLQSHAHSKYSLKICEQMPSENHIIKTIPLYNLEGWLRASE